MEAFKISLTGEHSSNTTTVHVPSNTTSYTSDNNISEHLDVGANHTISVCSLNSAGCSETVNASVGMYACVILCARADMHTHNTHYSCQKPLTSIFLHTHTLCITRTILHSMHYQEMYLNDQRWYFHANDFMSFECKTMNVANMLRGIICNEHINWLPRRDFGLAHQEQCLNRWIFNAHLLVGTCSKSCLV